MTQQGVLDKAEVACWNKRWEALEQMFAPEYKRLDRLSKYRNRKQNNQQLQDYKINTLTDLLHNLRVFGECQFRFFLEGFDQSPELFALPQHLESTTYAEYESSYLIAEFVLRTIVDQISYDLVAISKAIDQRFALVTGDREIFNQSVLADRLTLGALMMVSRSFGLDNQLMNIPHPPTTVLTYPRMSSNVRVIPYARVAFIGIPLTAVQAREDLLAIPHEVGHYLYWKTRLDEKTGEIKRTRTIPKLMHPIPPIEHWREEIFADIVACWIGGPIVALSMQALMRTYVQNQFLSDNANYPIPALRPRVYNYVLREKMGMTNIAGELETQWNNVLTARNIKLDQKVTILQPATGPGTTLQPVAGSTFLATSLDKLWDIVKKMIDQIWAEVIEKFDLFHQNPIELRWSQAETPLTNLRNQFFQDLAEKQPGNLIDRINQGIYNTKLDLDPSTTLAKNASQFDSGQKSSIWKKLAEEQLFVNGLPAWWQADHTPDYFNANTKQIPATDWLKIFEFGGWTAEGPDNQPGKK